jgi:hypothetical protein
VTKISAASSSSVDKQRIFMPILVRLLSRVIALVDFIHEALEGEEEIEVVYHFYTEPPIEELEP